MTLLNNLLHNDYLFITLWVGVAGTIGYAWGSESTKVFTSVNNITTSPVSSWQYNWTADRITDASPFTQSFTVTQQQILRFKDRAELDQKMIDSLKYIQQTSASILERVEKIKQTHASVSTDPSTIRKNFVEKENLLSNSSVIADWVEKANKLSEAASLITG